MNNEHKKQIIQNEINLCDGEAYQLEVRGRVAGKVGNTEVQADCQQRLEMLEKSITEYKKELKELDK